MSGRLQEGMIVVHRGGVRGVNSANAGKILRLGQRIGNIDGFSGVRWAVDRPVKLHLSDDWVHHANEAHLVELQR